MSAAVLQAEALEACLAKGPERLARRFFAKAAEVIDTPWQMAAGSDLSHPSLVAGASRMQRGMNRYIARLYRAASRDSRLSAAFLTVANLKARPASLFAPSVVWAVATRGAEHRRRERPSATHAELLGALAWQDGRAHRMETSRGRRAARADMLTDAD